jgi:hypothetical protein
MGPVLMSGMNFSLNVPESQGDTVLGFTGYGQFPIIKSIILETESGIMNTKLMNYRIRICYFMETMDLQ